MHQAERSSWLMIGSTMSEASGVVGVGEGDLEHAVVDEDDIEIEDGEGGKTEVWNGPSLSAWWDTAPVVLPIGFLRKRTHVSGLPQRSRALSLNIPGFGHSDTYTASSIRFLSLSAAAANSSCHALAFNLRA